MSKISLISGGEFTDERGRIRFVNAFDMSAVKRFYIVKNSLQTMIRGWRGHKAEQRWFYVVSGKFIVKFIKIDDWENPPRNLPVESYEVGSVESCIIHMPGGWASALQAVEPESEMIVFADYGIDNAMHDDFHFPIDYFENI